MPVPWYSRAYHAVLRAVGLERPEPAGFVAGSDFSGYPTTGYPPRPAKETMGEIGMLYAAETALASDLSTLPWKLTRKRPDGSTEAVNDHPFLDLLRNPSPRTPGIFLEQALWLDLFLTGKCAALVTWSGAQPIGLVHLPSDRTETIASPAGELDGVRYDGRTQYDWTTLLFCRMPSWRSEPEGVNGQGHIEALQSTLSTMWAAQEGLKKANNAGRPSWLVTPDKSDDPAMGMITDAALKKVREDIATLFKENHGGTAVMGRPLQATRLDYSPEELNQIETIKEASREILAVTGVVPVRLGSDATNYATAQEQRIGYWGDTLRGYADLLSSSLELAARRLYADPTIRIQKDFSGVPVLQAQQLTRLQKVSQHIVNGMPVAAAYRLEGMEEAAAAVEAADVPAEAPQAPAEPTKGARLLWFPAATVQRGVGAPVARAAPSLWRAAATTKIHAPLERKARRTAATGLAEQQARIIDALPASLPTASRAATGDEAAAEAIVDELMQGEAKALASHWRATILDMLVAAFGAGSKEIQMQLTWAPARRDAVVNAQLASLVTNINDTLKDKLKAEVLAAIRAGESVNDLQKRIQNSGAFAPSRALAIARTETTRSVNAGAQSAWKEAEKEGVTVRQKWLASPTSRPAHRALNGQVVELGEDFVVPAGVDFAGERGKGPGLFEPAGMCVNCTCSLAPVVD
jgi:phage portal protein BeeE